jgi:hypothetical protein
MAIDAESAGILIGNGLDVPTSLAGSVIEDQRPPVPLSRKDRTLRSYGMLAGILAFLAWTIWRSL